MKILLVGNGGREHALAWRLKRSVSCTGIVCPNGNPGIAREAETPAAVLRTAGDWAAFADAGRFDLVVVGPEAPLADGLADACQARGIRVFGPTAAGALIESSKAFAKDLMQQAGIPTARAQVFTDFRDAWDFAQSLGFPVVIKADGLAAGKGVTVAETPELAYAALHQNLVDHRFGAASARVLVEEFLAGEEASVLALCDGETVFPLLPAQDHKRLLDGDRGPNTGGMGAYAPAPVVSEEILSAVYGDILVPAVRAMAERGIVYRGVLYAGVMITATGPKVIEFNCRFGDPETQVLMPLFEGDLAEALLACAEGRLGALLAPPAAGQAPRARLAFRPDHALCVVMASAGYPAEPELGAPIYGLDAADGSEDAAIFHAGTRRGTDGAVVTSGGRVLSLTAWGSSLVSCRARAMALCERVSFRGAHYRRDIGRRALREGER